MDRSQIVAVCEHVCSTPCLKSLYNNNSAGISEGLSFKARKTALFLTLAKHFHNFFVLESAKHNSLAGSFDFVFVFGILSFRGILGVVVMCFIITKPFSSSGVGDHNAFLPPGNATRTGAVQNVGTRIAICSSVYTKFFVNFFV